MKLCISLVGPVDPKGESLCACGQVGACAFFTYPSGQGPIYLTPLLKVASAPILALVFEACFPFRTNAFEMVNNTKKEPFKAPLPSDPQRDYFSRVTPLKGCPLLFTSINCPFELFLLTQ